MPLYRYSAVSRAGEKLAGEMDALNRASVMEQLAKVGHLTVDIQEVGKAAAAAAEGGGLFSGNPSSSQITLFTREISMLLKAGLPLDQALTLLATEAHAARVKKLLGKLQHEINDGKSLHDAMALTGAFPPVYTSMVRAAEASGTLDVVLERVAQTREKEEKLRSRVMSALLYPLLLVCVSILAIVIILTFVVPSFKEMIMQAGTEVPAAAARVIAASDWLIAYWAYLIGGIAGSALLIIYLWRKRTFAPLFESALLGLPVAGTIIRLNLTIRFCRTLGTLLENGVDLLIAMDLTKNVMGNRLAVDALAEAHIALRKGQNYLQPLSKSGLFPPVVINMLRVGEETGDLHKSILFMAEMFEEKMETTVRRTFTILEPLIILLVSGFVAGIIISILGAVISINDLAL